ncbi:hypothetical protein D3C71_1754470 [compost metagenome]
MTYSANSSKAPYTKCCADGHCAKTASISVSSTAPSSGPIDEPAPPKSTSKRMNTDRLNVMKSELMYWFCCATMAPAMPQVTAAITKASTLVR